MKTNPDTEKRKNPFAVPEGYFENLTGRTMAAISDVKNEEAEHTEAKVKKLNFRPFIALAAAIIFFALMTAVIVRLAGGENNGPGQVAGDDLFASLVMEEVDTYTLENEWAAANAEEPGGQLSDLPDEAIIDLLIQENVELNEIYEIL